MRFALVGTFSFLPLFRGLHDPLKYRYYVKHFAQRKFLRNTKKQAQPPAPYLFTNSDRGYISAVTD